MPLCMECKLRLFQSNQEKEEKEKWQSSMM